MMRYLALFLLILCAGCAARPVAPLPLPPDLETELVARLEQNADAFRSLEGVAKVRVVSGGKTVSGTQVLFAEKPDHLRAEVLTPFGSPLLMLATDGTALTAMVPGENRFYRGEATSSSLMRFTRMPLKLEDLVHILLYQVPVIGHDRRSLEVEDGEVYRLTLVDGDGRRQELRFDAELNLVEAAYFWRDELQLQVNYDRFDPGAPPFPRTAALEMPAMKVNASVAFSEVETNVAIPRERFLLTAPPGVEILPLPR